MSPRRDADISLMQNTFFDEDKMTLKFPLLGTRLTLAHDVERYANFIARSGLTGVLVEAGADIISLKLDEDLPGAEQWNNCLCWYPGDPTGDEFWEDVGLDHPAVVQAEVNGGHVSMGQDGWWQWCEQSNEDSVYGGFESKGAAARDFLATYDLSVFPPVTGP